VALAVCLTATGCASTAAAGERDTRTYFIAADTVIWDYAPDRQNKVTGEPFSEDENVFVAQTEDRIGSSYRKCLYRGYTDKTFATPKPRPDSEAHLGYLGPVIRAEVGDTIKVVFRNNCSFPTSIHPHGVFHEKDGEGASHAVSPEGTHTYTWKVPEQAGPGPMDGTSAMWMYRSQADESSDAHAGLSGFLIVTAEGRANPDGSPEDVDREVFSMYEVADENSSPYLEENIRMFTVDDVDKDDDDFVESNLMHAINGYVYGNGPIPTVRKGERVRWYLMGMGTEAADLHTPHWHGNTVTTHGMRTDGANLLPGGRLVADMQPEATGTWPFHCHIGDHIAAGMQSLYRVTS
jgi:FtsP/CotA-like multicopper oxidase with cupredoxin domain